MKKRIILFLAIVVLPFLSMAQWRSKVDMAYLDSVASRGEEGWLMNRWGWWKFPPELTKQGGAAIKLQNKVLEMCGENRWLSHVPLYSLSDGRLPIRSIAHRCFPLRCRHDWKCIPDAWCYHLLLCTHFAGEVRLYINRI